MNNRWKDLAEQCVDQRLDGLHFDKEMFAELIVRQCIEWCDAHATINGTAQQVRNSIKQHFGIEDER